MLMFLLGLIIGGIAGVFIIGILVVSKGGRDD